jgi:hypothetical protein
MDGLNLLKRHSATGNVHRPPVAVLIVLPFPDQFRLHLRKRMRVIESPTYVVSHMISPEQVRPRSFKCRIVMEFSVYLLILRSSFLYQNGKSFLFEMAVIGEYFSKCFS